MMWLSGMSQYTLKSDLGGIETFTVHFDSYIFNQLKSDLGGIETWPYHRDKSEYSALKSDLGGIETQYHFQMICPCLPVKIRPWRD